MTRAGAMSPGGAEDVCVKECDNFPIRQERVQESASRGKPRQSVSSPNLKPDLCKTACVATASLQQKILISICSHGLHAICSTNDRKLEAFTLMTGTFNILQ
jgi:hypothetical protein